MPITEEHAQRIEDKLDKLTEAITKLVLIDERQIRQGERIGALEERCANVEKELITVRGNLNKWVWFGTGAWSVLTLVFAIVQFAVLIYLQQQA